MKDPNFRDFFSGKGNSSASAAGLRILDAAKEFISTKQLSGATSGSHSTANAGFQSNLSSGSQDLETIVLTKFTELPDLWLIGSAPVMSTAVPQGRPGVLLLPHPATDAASLARDNPVAPFAADQAVYERAGVGGFGKETVSPNLDQHHLMTHGSLVAPHESSATKHDMALTKHGDAVGVSPGQQPTALANGLAEQQATPGLGSSNVSGFHNSKTSQSVRGDALRLHGLATARWNVTASHPDSLGETHVPGQRSFPSDGATSVQIGRATHNAIVSAPEVVNSQAQGVSSDASEDTHAAGQGSPTPESGFSIQAEGAEHDAAVTPPDGGNPQPGFTGQGSQAVTSESNIPSAGTGSLLLSPASHPESVARQPSPAETAPSSSLETGFETGSGVHTASPVYGASSSDLPTTDPSSGESASTPSVSSEAAIPVQMSMDYDHIGVALAKLSGIAQPHTKVAEHGSKELHGGAATKPIPDRGQDHTTLKPDNTSPTSNALPPATNVSNHPNETVVNTETHPGETSLNASTPYGQAGQGPSTVLATWPSLANAIQAVNVSYSLQPNSNPAEHSQLHCEPTPFASANIFATQVASPPATSTPLPDASDPAHVHSVSYIHH